MATKSASDTVDSALAAARAEADAANRRLEALDQAVRGIAGVLSFSDPEPRTSAVTGACR